MKGFMLSLEEIKEAIEALPEDKFAELRKWMAEKAWQKLSQALRGASDTGELDPLVEEAKAKKG